MNTPRERPHPESDRSLYPPRPAGIAPGEQPGAGTGGGRIGRPTEMYIGAVFLTVAALPLVLVGGGLVLQLGALGTNLRQRITDAGVAVDVDGLVIAFRVGGGVLAAVGLLFVALAWVALRPRRRARTAVTVLAVVEMALLVFAMVVTAPDPVSVGLTLLAGAGLALLYLPRSEEFLLGAG